MKFSARAIAAAVVLAGCAKHPAGDLTASAAAHRHHPPHGGTPVVLGNELYHLEIVRDAEAGTLTAYVLDGEMEEFVRSSAPRFELRLTAPPAGAPARLGFEAVPNPATGETVGDTSEFAARGDWIRQTDHFDAQLIALPIRGSTFHDVDFNFPAGNDRD